MDDFDRLLELQLRRCLDRVVAAPVPFRRAPNRRTRVIHTAIELTPETMVAVPVQVLP